MGRRRKGGCLGLLFRLVGWLVLLGGLAFLGLLGYQLFLEHTVPRPGTYTAMLELGAQENPDGTPSVQLEWRLSKALDIYAHQRVPIVVTGAQGLDEPATEASVMQEWLVDKGVRPADVLAEESSFNTRENISNALALLPQGTRDVLIVTSDYHLPRALRVARDLGLNPSGAGSPVKPEYWLKNHFRETLAWGKYFVEKVVPLPYFNVP